MISGNVTGRNAKNLHPIENHSLPNWYTTHLIHLTLNIFKYFRPGLYARFRPEIETVSRYWLNDILAVYFKILKYCVLGIALRTDDVSIHVCAHLWFILELPTENAHLKSLQSQFQFVCPTFGSINNLVPRVLWVRGWSINNNCVPRHC